MRIFFYPRFSLSLSLNSSSPPFFHPPFTVPPLSLILFFFPRFFFIALHARHIETRQTKETVTPQLAKLLIYSLFNQINERVDAHFYAPVQLFMVYGNCPKQTRVHSVRSRPQPGPKLVSEETPFLLFRKETSPLARTILTFFITFISSSGSPASSFSPSAFDRRTPKRRPYDCLINGVSQPRGISL